MRAPSDISGHGMHPRFCLVYLEQHLVTSKPNARVTVPAAIGTVLVWWSAVWGMMVLFMCSLHFSQSPDLILYSTELMPQCGYPSYPVICHFLPVCSVNNKFNHVVLTNVFEAQLRASGWFLLRGEFTICDVLGMHPSSIQ